MSIVKGIPGFYADKTSDGNLNTYYRLIALEPEINGIVAAVCPPNECGILYPTCGPCVNGWKTCINCDCETLTLRCTPPPPPPPCCPRGCRICWKIWYKITNSKLTNFLYFIVWRSCFTCLYLTQDRGVLIGIHVVLSDTVIETKLKDIENNANTLSIWRWNKTQGYYDI